MHDTLTLQYKSANLRPTARAARGSARKTAKVSPAVHYFDPGFVVGMPRGGVYEQRRVSHLQNITILSPESVVRSTIILA